MSDENEYTSVRPGQLPLRIEVSLLKHNEATRSQKENNPHDPYAFPQRHSQTYSSREFI